MSSMITAIQDEQINLIKLSEREIFIAAVCKHLPTLALLV